MYDYYEASLDEKLTEHREALQWKINRLSRRVADQSTPLNIKEELKVRITVLQNMRDAIGED